MLNFVELHFTPRIIKYLPLMKLSIEKVAAYVDIFTSIEHKVFEISMFLRLVETIGFRSVQHTSTWYRNTFQWEISTNIYESCARKRFR